MKITTIKNKKLTALLRCEVPSLQSTENSLSQHAQTSGRIEKKIGKQVE